MTRISFDVKDNTFVFSMESTITKSSGKSHKSKVDRADKGDSIIAAYDNYVTIDLETTGFSPSDDEIIEFGAVLVEGGKIVGTFSELANPCMSIPHAVELKTGITNSMVKDARYVKDVLFDFLHFIRDLPLIGHNVSFDVNFLYDSAMRYFGHGIDNVHVDTARIVKRADVKLPNYKLGTCAEYCGIINNHAHRALDDAICAHDIYEKFKPCIQSGEVFPVCFAFGGYTYDAVFDSIQYMIGYDEENVTLKILKNGASVYMYGSLAFSIKINSRTRCLYTRDSVAQDYADKIPGAYITDGITYIPIASGRDSVQPISDLVNAVYKSHLRAVNGEMIGCCDMFIMCSDALKCLRSNDPHYNGCLYRKNLESGRIFYGKNKNI